MNDTSEAIQWRLKNLLEGGTITLEDAGHVQDFERFLRLLNDAPRDSEGRWIIPKEWGPYVRGEGDAPSVREP